jgi:hypothetical protein
MTEILRRSLAEHGHNAGNPPRRTVDIVKVRKAFFDARPDRTHIANKTAYNKALNRILASGAATRDGNLIRLATD